MIVPRPTPNAAHTNTRTRTKQLSFLHLQTPRGGSVVQRHILHAISVPHGELAALTFVPGHQICFPRVVHLEWNPGGCLKRHIRPKSLTPKLRNFELIHAVDVDLEQYRSMRDAVIISEHIDFRVLRKVFHFNYSRLCHETGSKMSVAITSAVVLGGESAAGKFAQRDMLCLHRGSYNY